MIPVYTFPRIGVSLHADWPNSVAVVTLVATVIPLVALFQVFDGVSAVTNGVLRARGKQVRSHHLTHIISVSSRVVQFVGALLNLMCVSFLSA